MDAHAQARTGTRYLALAPSFVASLAVTELFFKFGSFSLELVGFAALWAALYGVQSAVAKLIGHH